MKKPISILLALVLALSLGATALAADGNTDEITVLPGTASDYVYVTSVGTPAKYEGSVIDGSVHLTGPGFTAHSDDVPAGAVRLVVEPITDPDALAWFAGRAGEHWESTGTFYAVYYEDAAGERLPAAGVRMTVTLPGSYDDLNVYSVGEDGAASSLNYEGGGASVVFTTDGNIYYGVVRRMGAVDESLDVRPSAPDAWLDMSSGELADAVLSEEDRQYLDAGVDINVRLTVESANDTVSPVVVDAVERLAGDYTVGEYIEVELLKQIGQAPWENVHETSRPIRITVQIPERLLGPADRVFAIAQVHNGTASLLPDLDSDPDTITFETSQFSTFAILYYDPSPTATASARPGGSPPTGDGADPLMWMGILALCAAGLAVVLARGRRKD